MPRKRRTRAHIIADLAINHVERQVLHAGHSVERVWSNYGTDLLMFTYDANGEVENGLIFIQVRSTEHLRLVGDDRWIAVRVQTQHLHQWWAELYPFVLVVYDAVNEIAYWQLAPDTTSVGRSLQASVTIHVPTESVFDREAVRNLRWLKSKMVNPERREPDEVE